MNYRIIDIEIGTPEWLAWRKSKLGASDASAILGDNPWKTPYQLYLEKNNEEDSGKDNPAMKRGRELEPTVRNAINEDLSASYSPICLESVKYPFLAATLDGWDLTRKIPVLEIKCPSKQTHICAKEGDVPSHYFTQIQHQLLVSDQEIALYVSYNEDFATVLVERDEDFIKCLVEKESKFYENLKNKKEPALTDRDYFVNEDEDAILLQQKYLRLKESLNVLEEETEEARRRLIEKANGKNMIIGNLRMTKTNRKGIVDYGKIEAIKGINLDIYRKPSSTVWTLTSIS